MRQKKALALSEPEEEARARVEAFLGVPVVQHDDQTAPSMPDLRIEYTDRDRGAVEVVRDAQPQAVELSNAIGANGYREDVPGVARIWTAQLHPQARVRRVWAQLPALLAELERLGLRELTGSPFHFNPLEYQLFQMGVEHVLGGDGPTSAIALCGAVGVAWDGSYDFLGQWASTVLQENADVASKLSRSGFAERHAYIYATVAGDMTAYRALMDKPLPGSAEVVGGLPASDPVLPDGVDALWLSGLGRTIVWLPERGWLNVP
ncbi:hypothetical protein ACFPM7_28155 [Actinokineospora guangxiensis]|uniref:Uncharacterized protein n=1 Tax=Actinokineospora guangxiensis TaxID=1490288 RepID=A0ABW0EXP2_9PSEU